jgi:tryptophanyl-tRNA synthetase
LQEIGDKYGSGKMLTGEIKKILITVLQKFVLGHQEQRKGITNE